jgi:hypothetical protein
LARRYALLALVTHSAFISLSLAPGIRAIPLLSGDSARYVRVANNIVHHRAISMDSAPPFRWEADRPPGYPLLIATSIGLTGHEHWTLYFAALSAAAAAWAAVTLTGLWTDRKRAFHAAGLLVAFMPNSVGLSAMLLVDALFGHLMLVWCCLVQLSFRHLRRATVFGCVLVFTYLQLLRPQLLVLGWAIILFATLIFGRPRYRMTLACILVLGSLIVPVYLTVRTYRDHGIATPTMVGIRSGREYLQAKYIAEESGREFVTARDFVRSEDSRAAEQLTEPESLTARRYLVAQARLKEFLWSHPGDVTRLMGMEFARQAVAPQEFAASVILDRSPISVRMLGMLVTILLLALTGIGACNVPDRRVPLFVFGVMAFYLATGSLTQFNGSRLRFPADMTAVPLAAIGAASLRRAGVSTRADDNHDARRSGPLRNALQARSRSPLSKI